MIFGVPMALLPAVALSLGGEARQAEVLGLFAAPAAGAFLATLLSGRAKEVRRQGKAIMLSIVVWGGAIVVFGLSNVLWLSLLMLAVAGAGDMVSGIFRLSIIQAAAVEDHFRGRLEGIGMAVWATGHSLGDVESGAVATLTTPTISIVSGGLVTIAGIGLLGGSRRVSAATTQPETVINRLLSGIRHGITYPSPPWASGSEQV